MVAIAIALFLPPKMHIEVCTYRRASNHNRLINQPSSNMFLLSSAGSNLQVWHSSEAILSGWKLGLHAEAAVLQEY